MKTEVKSRIILFEKPFLVIEWDADNKLLIQNWKGFASSSQFREGIEKSVEIFRQKQVLRLLSNTKESSVVKKEDTEWAATYALGNMVKNGLKAVAFIVPTSVFAGVSVSNFEEKSHEMPVVLKYFDDVDKAIEWLISVQ